VIGVADFLLPWESSLILMAVQRPSERREAYFRSNAHDRQTLPVWANANAISAKPGADQYKLFRRRDPYVDDLCAWARGSDLGEGQ
jgi:hypothetical protein